MAGSETAIQDVFVSSVMSQRVESVPPTLPATAAAQRLFDSDIGSLLVDAESGPPAGIVTETDFVELVANERDPATTVAECMSSPVVTTSPSAKLEAAAEKMADENVKKLPVVQDGPDEIVGIITTTDIAKYLPVHEFHPED